MRLVRDDDDVAVMEQQELQSPLMDPQDDSLAPDDSADGDSPALPLQRQGDSPSSEPPDGEIEASDEESNEASDVQVDLGALEALLFSTHHPLTAGRLAELLDLASTRPIRRAIKELNELYLSSDRSFRVEQVAGGFQMLTLPRYGDVLKALHQREIDAKLTKAALETLAIIAYKQPILRADVESIRGVACGETIRSLMEKRLVKIAGRAEVPGRPILYGTTKRFLEIFGLNTLKDLPQGEGRLSPGENA